MDVSGPREGGGAMKPESLRVGVALILSATGLIFARFLSWKEDNEVTSSASNPETSSSPSREEERETIYHLQKQEILSLKSRFEDLQRKEYEMELRFKHYCNLKDQEVILIEHKSMLSLEKSQLDFFRKEISAMEEEHTKGQDLVTVYLKLVREIQELRSENLLLERKANKIRRRTKQLYNVLNKKNRRILGVEKEFLKCLDELEKTNDVMKELNDLKANVVVLQKEKEEVSKKFSDSNSEVSAEDYRRFLEEYEDLKKDFANGVKEVINLRWNNACLRHKVMRNGTKYGEIVFSPNGNLQDLGLEDQVDALELNEQHEENQTDHHDGENNHNHHHESSKRKRLMKKLKRWIEGNEKVKSTKVEERRCLGRHSLTVEDDEEGIFHSRRSCSSV